MFNVKRLKADEKLGLYCFLAISGFFDEHKTGFSFSFPDDLGCLLSRLIDEDLWSRW